MPHLRDVANAGLQRIRLLLRRAYALYLLVRDPRTPLPARVLALAVLAYVISPIDIIPDPLPFGLFDDAAVVALGLAGVRRLAPPALLEEGDALAGAGGAAERRFHRLLVVVAVSWAISLVLLVAAVWWWLHR